MTSNEFAIDLLFAFGHVGIGAIVATGVCIMIYDIKCECQSRGDK